MATFNTTGIQKSRLHEKCYEGEDCGFGLYCERIVGYCVNCINCRHLNRETPYACVTHIDDCGPCLKGTSSNSIEPVLCHPQSNFSVITDQTDDTDYAGLVGALVTLTVLLIFSLIALFLYLKKRGWSHCREGSEEQGFELNSLPPAYREIYSSTGGLLDLQHNGDAALFHSREGQRNGELRLLRSPADWVSSCHNGVIGDQNSDYCDSEATTAEEDNDQEICNLRSCEQANNEHVPVVRNRLRRSSSLSSITRVLPKDNENNERRHQLTSSLDRHVTLQTSTQQLLATQNKNSHRLTTGHTAQTPTTDTNNHLELKQNIKNTQDSHNFVSLRFNLKVRKR